MYSFDCPTIPDNIELDITPVDAQYEFYDNDTPRLDIPSSGSPTLEQRFMY